MGLVVFNSRQPYQKAKFTKKYDEDFAAATIIRICDADAAISVNSAPQNCQSQHRNAVNKTQSTHFTNTQQTNSSYLPFALNCHSKQLLHSLSANAAQFYFSNKNNLSNTLISPLKLPPDTQDG